MRAGAAVRQARDRGPPEEELPRFVETADPRRRKAYVYLNTCLRGRLQAAEVLSVLPCTGEVAQPSSWVKFDVPTNVQRVAQYLTQAFVSTEEVECVDNQVTSYYVGLDGAPLRVEARKDVSGTQITISTNDLATAAEVVQDICTNLDVHELESEASFPDESRRLKETLERVSTHNSIRVRLTAEMADGSSRVKALVLKAEDARLMADMPRMMRNYDELMRVNEELIAEYNKRATNHEALLAALKQVNQVVQRASSLRVGKAIARVVADARRAIKKGDSQALLSLIATGRTGG